MKRIYLSILLLFLYVATYAQTLNGIYIGRYSDNDVRIYKFQESREYWIYDGEGYLLEEGTLSIEDNVAEFRHSTLTYTAELGQGGYRNPIFIFHMPDGPYQMQLYMQLFNTGDGHYWYGEEFADYPVPEFRVREVIDIKAAREAYARARTFGDVWQFEDKIYVLISTGKYKLADLDGRILEEGWWEVAMGRFYFSKTRNATNRNAVQYDFIWLDDYTVLMIDPETDEELGTMVKIGRRKEKSEFNGA